MKPEVILGIIIGALFIGAWLLVFAASIQDRWRGRYRPRHRYTPLHRA